MTRWHTLSCQTPDVVVEDHSPKCRSCSQSCPSTEQLLLTLAKTSSSLELPPDELPGRMNLWWPRSVPYTNNETEPDEIQRPPVAEPSCSNTTRSYIYTNTLESKELRLVSLSAVLERDYPVHLSLEVFTHDDRPEYECVSYTWGGENNDNTLCRPIYIGPYWDVLLQTNNCWSMLQFMRPWRGTRTIWVDALCINQHNLAERAAQVAKMRKIYEESTRVVVYLGEDLISSTRRFPAIRPLPTLDNSPDCPIFPESHKWYGEEFDFKKLLARRFFSRVWVIQELLASQSALIRVGEINFTANATNIATLNTISDGVTWSETAAPWVQYLAHGGFPKSGVEDLFSLLKLTCQCRATDPRDRLFAVISLLESRTLRHDFAPDYALSFRHFCIGIFAHLVLVERRYWFLNMSGIAAQSRNGTHSLPSWVPDCISDDVWQQIFADAKPYSWLPSTMTVAPCYGAFQVYHEETGSNFLGDVVKHENSCGKPYYDDCSVNTTDGSLQLNLTHLFRFEESITLVTTIDTFYAYRLHPEDRIRNSLRPDILLVTTHRLDIQPMTDHLYILDRGPVRDIRAQQFHRHVGDLHPVVYLLLRCSSSDNDLPTFQLVTSCISLCPEGRLDTFTNPLIRGGFKDAETCSVVNTLHVMYLMHLQLDVATVLSFLSKKLGRRIVRDQLLVGGSVEYKWQKFFPQRAGKPGMADALFVLLHALFEEQCNSQLTNLSESPLVQAYLECNRQFQAKLVTFPLASRDWPVKSRSVPRDQQFIELTLDESTWRSNKSVYPVFERHDCSWTFTWEAGTQYQNELHREASTGASLPNRVLARARLVPVMNWIRRELEPIQKAAQLVMKAYNPPLSVETLKEMVRVGPTEEQKHIGVPKYMGSVKVDGSTSKVRIL